MISKIFNYIRQCKSIIFIPIYLISLSVILCILNYLAYISLFFSEKIDNYAFLMLISMNIIVIISLLIYIIYQLSNFFKFYYKSKFILNFKIKIILVTTTICLVSILFIILFSFSFFKLNSKILVSNIIDKNFAQSLQISEIYIKEQKQNMINNIINVRNFAEKNAKLMINKPLDFDNKFLQRGEMLSLSEIVIFFYNKKNKTKQVISKSEFSFFPIIEKMDIQQYNFDDDNQYNVIFKKSNNYIRVLTKINTLPNTYILIGKVINDKIFEHINNIDVENANYIDMQQEIEYIRGKLYLLFTLTILLILFSVFLLVLHYATRFFLPILDLLSATRKVSQGYYNNLLDVSNSAKEITVLLKSFNRMTKNIERKSNDINLALHIANNETRFLKSVIGSLPISLLVVDLSLKVKLFNKEAGILLAQNNKKLKNMDISEILLNINILLDKLHNSSDHYINDRAIVKSFNDNNKELPILLSVKSSFKEIEGYIIILYQIQ